MSVDNFIPEIWADKFQEVLDPALVYPKCCNTDYEGEIKNFGDTVRVNTIGPVTIAPYTKGTLNLVPEVINGAGQPMNIDQADFFFFALDDVDKAQVKGSVMEAAMKRASFGMKNSIDTFVATLMAAGVHEDNILEVTGTTSSSFAQPIQVGVGQKSAYELLVMLTTRLNKANVPDGERWCVIPPDFVEQLLLDQRFTSFGTASAMAAIKEGSTAGGELGQLGSVLRTLLSMDIMVSNKVPVGGAGNGVFTILAGYKGATSFASQIAEGQPEAFRLQGGFADAVRGLQLYGGKVFEPAGLVSAYVDFV
jgi:hypothetical protein